MFIFTAKCKSLSGHWTSALRSRTFSSGVCLEPFRIIFLHLTLQKKFELELHFLIGSAPHVQPRAMQPMTDAPFLPVLTEPTVWRLHYNSHLRDSFPRSTLQFSYQFFLSSVAGWQTEADWWDGDDKRFQWSGRSVIQTSFKTSQISCVSRDDLKDENVQQMSRFKPSRWDHVFLFKQAAERRTSVFDTRRGRVNKSEKDISEN